MKSTKLVLVYCHSKPESKHAGLKGELALTNRSRKSNIGGKWWQVMRSNYIRSFYLPEHQPAPPSYTSHFKSRTPSHCNSSGYCDCGRKKEMFDLLCFVCHESKLVVDCARKQKLSGEVVVILKPILCNKCNKRFGDVGSFKVHSDLVHMNSSTVSYGSKSSLPLSNETQNVKSMTVEQLKYNLRVKGLSTSGRKDILLRRLEGALSADL